ncbi:unnamed protein product [Rotaria socialis]|uniref:Uncharacterized protein n=1 Tax=Rotaria socialis TaxID=392032 RepID=A0A818R357_9BILA|nr:unnamed protein product [Rotaria socialis]CAF3437577.1 unnamed protein product [Rotaria socialis]CAF3646216.1 unnamed protein product [Rotaria socialis]CAF3657660.1 unnamed protein product [Rotaria socialis]CAF3720530.1 unnamed protein product [Rotaria socialis]
MSSAGVEVANHHTALNELNSNDDVSSEATEDLLPAIENGHRLMFGKTIVRVSRVPINHNDITPKFKIRYLYRPNDEKKSIDVRRKSNSNEHVKITRLQRSDLHGFPTNLTLFTLKANSREKNTTNVNGFRPNKKLPEIVNGHGINKEIRHVTSQQSATQANRTPMAAHINKDSNHKVIASKPMVIRLPREMNQNKLHISVKHRSGSDKK